MNILITKNNADFIKGLMKAKTLRVITETEHTLTLKITMASFKRLHGAIKSEGLNPYALMSW